MPNTDETYEHACNGAWEPIAGSGRVFLENLARGATLNWAIAGAAGPGAQRGYSLPPAHGARSGAEGLIVPAGKLLWIRGAAGDAVAVTAETLP